MEENFFLLFSIPSPVQECMPWEWEVMGLILAVIYCQSPCELITSIILYHPQCHSARVSAFGVGGHGFDHSSDYIIPSVTVLECPPLGINLLAN